MQIVNCVKSKLICPCITFLSTFRNQWINYKISGILLGHNNNNISITKHIDIPLEYSDRQWHGEQITNLLGDWARRHRAPTLTALQGFAGASGPDVLLNVPPGYGLLIWRVAEDAGSVGNSLGRLPAGEGPRPALGPAGSYVHGLTSTCASRPADIHDCI